MVITVQVDRILRVTEPLFLFIKLSQLPLTLGLQSLPTYTSVILCHTDDSRRGWQTLLEIFLAQALSLMRHSQAKCLHHASEPVMEQKRVCFQSPLSGSEPGSVPGAPCLLIHPAQLQFVLPADCNADKSRREPSLHWEAQETKSKFQSASHRRRPYAVPGARVHCKALAETWDLRCHELC